MRVLHSAVSTLIATRLLELHQPTSVPNTCSFPGPLSLDSGRGSTHTHAPFTSPYIGRDTSEA